MAGHARLSASQTKRWATCPGSAAYLEANPLLEDSGSEYARQGTCAHALVERCLREGSAPASYKGRLITIIEDAKGHEGVSILKKNAPWPKDPTRVVFEVDLDMIEAVECMTDYVINRCIDLCLHGSQESPENPAKFVAELIKFDTVRLEGRSVPLPERDDTGGTSDVVIDAWPDLIEVVDYKHGAGVFVPVESNEQLRSYGLGELLKAGQNDYEKVQYTICQPRHMQAPQDGIMSEEVSAKELLMWQDWLSTRAGVVDDARALMATGATLEDLDAGGYLSTGSDGGGCTFCPLMTRCPAALRRSQEMADTEFDDDPKELEADAGPNRLAVLLPWVPFIDRWVRAIEADAERLMMQGGHIEGQKVVRKRSTGRKWLQARNIAPEKEGDEPTVEIVTEEDIVAKLVDLGAKEEDCYTAPKLLSGPQAEKLIPKKKRQELEDEFMYKPEGGLTIAPEDDTRDAVVVDPASDFDGVED